ncbi:N-acetylglucosamine-6-phosphate deacetylase [Aequitasia blattaphilus]|uniref:N-acetylglucosamine-6-phosphate deacetylase n=1 Tax=Aequitasia blattaphilus TaxID=2949332 RepID=A0ABT1EA50_9FIRM|nr:N-acetylglucosamine-6-phosphate deacetylase [Aequitasia blattaphilus]MCP1102687.1 N-acetylglucosamine-6-phosphate deacetylase [Aequitasia blattaphilus]MCR8615327.1 N-acetylglucosamine-6-phosphate deacetylase [Aequitasia blattaphilus]
MIIRNGLVFGEDGLYTSKDIFIEGGRIVSDKEGLSDRTSIDASGLKVIPGLIDIHSHGAAGYDFSDGSKKGLVEILKYQKSQGITSYCPTSMSLPEQMLMKAFKTAADLEKDEKNARIVGINMEGPFLDVVKKGAHRAEYIKKPDIEMFKKCNEISGNQIKIVTLAPDIKGGEKFIEELQNQVVIALGHTEADYETCIHGLKKGANHITHLYNAMLPLGHREPGLVGAAFDCENCTVELIGDGVHVHPSVVRMTFQLFGSKRVILVSDSMRATGMENGKYDLGGQTVVVENGKATLTDGTIAGSAVNLFTCVKRVISMGVPEGMALLAATRNPAKRIGIYHDTGSLTAGKRADIVLTDQNLNVLEVL